MKTILQNWSLIRLIRIIFGVLAVVQGMMVNDMGFKMAGTLLLLTAVANIGCCGGSCSVNLRQPKEQKEVVYEEVETTR